MKEFEIGKSYESTVLFVPSFCSVALFMGCNARQEKAAVELKPNCEEFLKINHFSEIVEEAEAKDTDLDLTPEEHDILMEVYSRILKNCKRIDNQPDFSSISAENLNIDSTMFRIVLNALAPYMTGEKVVGED